MTLYNVPAHLPVSNLRSLSGLNHAAFDLVCIIREKRNTVQLEHLWSCPSCNVYSNYIGACTLTAVNLPARCESRILAVVR